MFLHLNTRESCFFIILLAVGFAHKETEPSSFAARVSYYIRACDEPEANKVPGFYKGFYKGYLLYLEL